MKTLKLIGCYISAIAITTASNAAGASSFPDKYGYQTDERGNVVKNSYGECWRTGYWTPEMAIAECDPGLVKKEVQPPKAAVQIQPMPAQAPAPAPAPAMAPAPAPQQSETWKTILTETPVRLEGANFATNSSRLLNTADVKLNEVVNAAKRYPEVMLDVSGHTDNRGSKALNQKLSENRAASVKAWLVKHGVAADRIITAGYADTQPVADNKTKEGRADNRRVDVRYVIKSEERVRVAK